MTDFLEVKALRTFAVGAGVKTRKSPTFPVEAGEARQLEALGYVEIVGEVEVADAVDVVVVDETETETPVVDAEPAPAKRGRKAKADAVDEDS